MATTPHLCRIITKCSACGTDIAKVRWQTFRSKNGGAVRADCSRCGRYIQFLKQDPLNKRLIQQLQREAGYEPPEQPPLI